jgi:hypothetical protein
MNNSAAEHYVYEWVRPDYNEVYYVGKGSGKRAWNMVRSTDKTNNVTAKLIRNGMVPEVRIIAWFLTKQAALAFEVERIAFLKPIGFLTNGTKGGDGGDTMSGKKHKPESIAKMSAAQKGKKKNYDVWNKGKPMPEERKSQLILINTGNKYFLGKSHSDETKKKISQSRLGIPAHNKGKTASEEAKYKMSAAKKGKTPKHLIKAVIEIEGGNKFESITEAARFYGLRVSDVSMVCRGKRKTVGGLKFKFIEAL